MRGQPPKIEPERYAELLELLGAGLSMPTAAERMGVARATLYNLAARVPAMGEAMQRARAAAKAARKARHEPSESCYVNDQCRLPGCTAAATEARARRRAPQPAPAVVLPAPARRITLYELLAADDAQPLADSA
ncbi:helix-turn-helix domain-containing protein [Streptomyces sp. NPDC056653]|uniref:helix-turn-helix domain-containing protein n=1 Tax=Streptomyces sp. NPDC056653 TaxID=3345894 RepID=UPI00367B859C